MINKEDIVIALIVFIGCILIDVTRGDVLTLKLLAKDSLFGILSLLINITLNKKECK